MYDTYVNFKNGKKRQRKSKKKYFDSLLNYADSTIEQSDCIILDLGCGDCEMIEYFAAKGMTQVQGVDLLDYQTDNPNFYQSDLLEFLKNTDKTFDLIFAMDVFEHLELNYLREVIVWCEKRSKNGGALLFRVPNASSPFFSNFYYSDLTHIRPFNKSSIKQLLGSLNLEYQIRGDLKFYNTYKSFASSVCYNVYAIIYNIMFFLCNFRRCDFPLTENLIIKVKL